MTTICHLPSPVGELILVGDAAQESLLGLWICGEKHAPPADPLWRHDDRAFPTARRQLQEYFAGERITFTLNLAPSGTPFQMRVWDALCAIPYGVTITYGEQAKRIGNPKASRAVGLANGRNPLSLIVPCHRVIGANGALTGYGGGLATKRWLLDHEARHASSKKMIPAG